MQILGIYLYVTAVGFVAAGVLASFVQLVSGEPMRFGPAPIHPCVDRRGTASRLAGPAVLMRNAWRGLFSSATESMVRHLGCNRRCLEPLVRRPPGYADADISELNLMAPDTPRGTPRGGGVAESMLDDLGVATPAIAALSAGFWPILRSSSTGHFTSIVLLALSAGLPSRMTSTVQVYVPSNQPPGGGFFPTKSMNCALLRSSFSEFSATVLPA